MELSEVHARMYAALMGRTFFDLDEEKRKTAQAREREINERRPEPTLPQDAHRTLLEAFGGGWPVSAPADAHQRLAHALRRF